MTEESVIARHTCWRSYHDPFESILQKAREGKLDEENCPACAQKRLWEWLNKEGAIDDRLMELVGGGRNFLRETIEKELE